MAASGGREKDALLSNPILQDIHGSIAHILRGIGCTSKPDIVAQLVEDVDGDIIRECRDHCFGAAVTIYDEQLESHGVAGKANIELKNRRGDNSIDKCAADIIDMIVYICGLTKCFPREIISARSVYVDIESIEPNIQVEEETASENIINENDDISKIVKSLCDKCEGYEKAIKRLWEYLMNVEKIHGDELSTMKNTVHRLTDVKGLNAESHVDTEHIDHAEWPLPHATGGSNCDQQHNNNTVTDPAHAANNPGGSTSRANSKNREGPNNSKRLTGDQLAQTGHNESLSVLLQDGSDNSDEENEFATAPTHDTGDSSESDDDISCAQKSRRLARVTKNGDINHSQQRSNGKKSTGISDKNTSLSQTRIVPDVTATAETGIFNVRNAPPPNEETTERSLSSQPNTTSSSGTTLPRSYCDTASSPGPWNLVTKRIKTRRQQNEPLEGTPQTNPSQNSSSQNNTTRNTSSQNTSSQNTTLRGLQMEPSVDLYVQNIERREGEALKAIADKVRKHLRSKDIRIMSARTIINRYCEDIVGCKITIPARQVDDVLGNRIWPDNVICRRWNASRGQASEHRNNNGGRQDSTRNRRQNDGGRNHSNSNNSRDIMGSRSRRDGGGRDNNNSDTNTYNDNEWHRDERYTEREERHADISYDQTNWRREFSHRYNDSRWDDNNAGDYDRDSDQLDYGRRHTYERSNGERGY